jgi:hypothetical protein
MVRWWRRKRFETSSEYTGCGVYSYLVDGGGSNTSFTGLNQVETSVVVYIRRSSFVLDPETTLEDALVENAEEAAKDDKGVSRGPQKRQGKDDKQDGSTI